MGYRPYPKQLQFHEAPHKFRAFIGGLGSGKSYAGAVEAILTMAEYPNTLGAVLAPTYSLLRDSTIKTLFSLLPKDVIKQYNKTEQHLILTNGSECIFRPCDDTNSIDRLRNINLGWVWIDEASLTQYYAFKVLIGRMRDPKGPLKFWLTTTPKGYNWIWRKFVDEPSKDPEKQKTFFMVTTSSRENIYLPEDYVETLMAEYTGVFAKQEIEGLFVGFEGLVYSEFNRNTHVIDTTNIKIKNAIIGVDFGFTNPSAMIKVGYDYDGRAYLMEEFYQKGITDHELAEIAKEKYGTEVTYIADSANPSGIEEFNQAGLNCMGVEKKSMEGERSFVIAGIKKVSGYVKIAEDGKPRLFVDMRCVNTIMEFENYRYPDSQEDKPIQELPLKIHDHILDAVRYILVGRSIGWGSPIDISSVFENK